MRTLTIRPSSRLAPLHLAALLAIMPPLLLIVAIGEVQSSRLYFADAPVSVNALIFGSWLATTLFIFMTRLEITLAVEEAPIRIKTYKWFGKFESTRRKSLLNIVWARVAPGGSAKLPTICVEVGTYGYVTTIVFSQPLSPVAAEKGAAILEAKEMCTKVAEFLKIEDKGFTNEKWLKL